jgi:hypothetical protein
MYCVIYLPHQKKTIIITTIFESKVVFYAFLFVASLFFANKLGLYIKLILVLIVFN